MEIILKKDVANLGHADDIVKVKTGYAVNYLIPQGYATLATESAKKVHAENLRQRAHKEAKFRADAEALAAKLAEVVVKVSAKVSEAKSMVLSQQLRVLRLSWLSESRLTRKTSLSTRQ